MRPRIYPSASYKPPHPVAVKAHSLLVETDLRQPRATRMGRRGWNACYLQRLGTLFHAQEDTGGYGTLGGTETDIQALRLAKEPRPSACPNMVVPQSSKDTFKKACDLLCLDVRNMPLGPGKGGCMPISATGYNDRDAICLVGVFSARYHFLDGRSNRRLLKDRVRALTSSCTWNEAFGGMVIPFP